MCIGSLFSGAGGLDMAIQAVFGGEVAWHCENDAAASKVLATRWPGVPNHHDITAVDWEQVEPVEVVDAGWPCQPWSVAGARKGAEDARALWPEVARAVRALRPRLVVLENVPNIIILGELARAVGDLAAIGYDAQWVSVRASDVGSCHKRERVFILAHAASDGRHEGWPEPARLIGRPNAAVCGGESLELLPTPAAQRSGRNRSPSPGATIRPSLDSITDLLPTPTAQDAANCAGPSQYLRNTRPLNVEVTLLPTPAASDGNGGKSSTVSGGTRDSGQKRSIPLTDMPHFVTQWGKYEPAVRRWEHLSRPAPSPTEPNTRGKPRLAPAFSEWMMGWPAGWVTDLVLPMKDPRPDKIRRNDALRIIGNGVVPQQAQAAIRWLLSVSEAVA